MKTALTVLALAAAGFALTADDVAEETPPATEEEATPETPPVDCETLEDEDAKAKCIEDAKAKEADEEAPKKAGKGRSTSGNMDMEGEADE